MSREVRMVPKDWQHPKNGYDNFDPLFAYNENLEEEQKEWDKKKSDWDSGIYPTYADDESKELNFENWEGERPNRNNDMPKFDSGTDTYYMMYETTTEGTPISPAFETPELLARWLSDSEANSFGSQSANYESWLRVAKGGYACSAVVINNNGIQSGVEGLS